MRSSRVHVRKAGDPRLVVALGLTLLFHGGLLAAGSHRRTYDAYVHLFFADHYQRNWFSSWEPRWYTGFPIISYPPGVHQLLAVTGRIFGSDTGYAAIQVAMLLLLIVGVYRFASVWQGKDAAGWAAIVAAFSSSLAEVVHVFGQLPTTAALAFLLNAQPSIKNWIIDGRRSDLASALALLAATTAVHHVTTLFGSVFFTGPIVASALLQGVSTPLRLEVQGRAHRVSRQTLTALAARRVLRVTAPLRRTTVLGVATVALLVTIILPYWIWSSSDPISQVPIPHGSRDNFIENRNTGLVFWVVPWSSVLLVLPAALWTGVRRNTWPLAASVLLLTVLGTGGTTPIPRIMLGGAFDILTLDRFTIWATIAVLPFVGTVVSGLVAGGPTHLLARAIHRSAPRVALAVLALVAAGSSLFASSLANYRPTQPDPIDPEPIVAFMERDEHDRWRYLMLGFGDQMANVSAQTTARTVDGNYHSARRLPELTSHSVERLEGAKFRGVAGLGSLQEFVGAPARYNLKFIFSNDAFYDPMLWSAGWQRIGDLSNGVIVWERADIPPLLTHEERPEIPSWQRLIWGILPLSAIGTALVALTSILLCGNGKAPVQRLTRTDRWLQSRAARLDSIELEGTRYPYGFTLSLPAWTGVAATRGALILLTIALGFGAFSLRSGPNTPSDVVERYFDHIDFQRFEEAWATLEPTSRPTLEDYLTDISLQDGLVAGYAKLETLKLDEIDSDSVDASVRATATYLTSVQTITRERTIQLRRSDNEWDHRPGAAHAIDATNGQSRSSASNDLRRTLHCRQRRPVHCVF